MEEYKPVDFQFGFVFLRTKRFQSLMDRLGRNRISKPWGWFLLYVMPVAAGIGLFIFLAQFAILFSPAVHNVGNVVREVSPLGYLGVPGLNPYLPIIDGWAALIVAMVVHEGAHGIVARSLGIPVKSAGLLFFLVIPVGAFVEVDDEVLKAARARDSGRVLAAGAGVNFVIGIIALLLLFSVVSTMTPAVNGIGVTQVVVPSPAATAGLQPGDFITAINGVPYTDPTLIAGSSWYKPGQAINITVWRDGVVKQFDNVTLGVNPQNSSRAFLGVTDIGSGGLQAIASGYTGSFFTRPALYLCIPTLPQCENAVPFSGSLSGLYTSSYGGSLVPLASLLYWFFFLNFNLAVFNAMPLYPLDGGQAFRVGVKALGKGRLSEGTLTRISMVVTLAIILAIFSVPVAAYLNLI